MDHRVDVAIIGAGTAGLAAVSEVRRAGASFVLVDGGELGTTCARVGCMPSKALLQVAEDYARRQLFERFGIEGAASLRLCVGDVLEHVRDLRDLFVDRVLEGTTDQMSDEFIAAPARPVVPRHVVLVLPVGDGDSGVPVRARYSGLANSCQDTVASRR